MKPILTNFKNFFSKKVVHKQDSQLFAVIEGQQELYIEDARTSDYCTLKWRVKNQT